MEGRAAKTRSARIAGLYRTMNAWWFAAMFDNALFLLQIAVIIGFSRLVAWAFGRLGQPQVIGEMAAGIMLGPTLFGWLFPRLVKILVASVGATPVPC
jgi:hypothetical protein